VQPLLQFFRYHGAANPSRDPLRFCALGRASGQSALHTGAHPARPWSSSSSSCSEERALAPPLPRCGECRAGGGHERAGQPGQRAGQRGALASAPAPSTPPSPGAPPQQRSCSPPTTCTGSGQCSARAFSAQPFPAQFVVAGSPARQQAAPAPRPPIRTRPPICGMHGLYTHCHTTHLFLQHYVCQRRLPEAPRACAALEGVRSCGPCTGIRAWSVIPKACWRALRLVRSMAVIATWEWGSHFDTCGCQGRHLRASIP